uniref:Uncharacterized protein n=1 Tax=Anopheles dirus TaxID=7168 RepID=A0A182NY71_9DIPT
MPCTGVRVPRVISSDLYDNYYFIVRPSPRNRRNLGGVRLIAYHPVWSGMVGGGVRRTMRRVFSSLVSTLHAYACVVPWEGSNQGRCDVALQPQNGTLVPSHGGIRVRSDSSYAEGSR